MAGPIDESSKSVRPRPRSVTAYCSTWASPWRLSDGAAAALLASAEFAKEIGATPLARWVGYAVAGVEPEIMGIGPVPASQKLLARTGVSIDQIDVIELNEAFASQAVACINELGADRSRVNPNGGAIAMGHPIGATGAILLTKLVHELERTGKKYGVVTLCIAGGMGIASVVENMRV